MIARISSLFIWAGLAIVVIAWVPLLWVIKTFDRDPVRYRTGHWFRRCGVAMTYVNPFWRIKVSGVKIDDPRRPYIVVGNHQSMADIPLISHLPWEMKWVAKIELFRTPIVGWMMTWVKDISVDRQAKDRRVKTLKQCMYFLKNQCSVMFFPEGTRTKNGKVGKFNDGAFALAVKMKVPIIPLVVDGSYDCIPTKSWVFNKGVQNVKLEVLPPIDTSTFKRNQTEELRDLVRNQIIGKIAEWRNVDPSEIDGLAGRAKAVEAPKEDLSQASAAQVEEKVG